MSTKFLVIWSFPPGVKLSSELMEATLRHAEYAKKLESEGKVEHHYHIVGKHGGVWIFDVESNDELERLIAGSPVYNFAQYEVFPLTEPRKERR